MELLHNVSSQQRNFKSLGTFLPFLHQLNLTSSIPSCMKKIECCFDNSYLKMLKIKIKIS